MDLIQVSELSQFTQLKNETNPNSHLLSVAVAFFGMRRTPKSLVSWQAGFGFTTRPLSSLAPLVSGPARPGPVDLGESISIHLRLATRSVDDIVAGNIRLSHDSSLVYNG